MLHPIDSVVELNRTTQKYQLSQPITPPRAPLPFSFLVCNDHPSLPTLPEASWRFGHRLDAVKLTPKIGGAVYRILNRVANLPTSSVFWGVKTLQLQAANPPEALPVDSAGGGSPPYPRYNPHCKPPDLATVRVCMSAVLYVKRNLLLLVTSASGLPLRTIKFCFLLFSVVVHAGCDKQDSLVCGGLCGKMHDRPSQLLIAVQQSSAYPPTVTPPAFDVHNQRVTAKQIELQLQWQTDRPNEWNVVYRMAPFQWPWTTANPDCSHAIIWRWISQRRYEKHT